MEKYFEKCSSEMLKNMQHLEEVCNVTLVSQGNDRIRAQVPLVGMIPISCNRVVVVIIMIIFWVARQFSYCSQNCLLHTESVKKI